MKSTRRLLTLVLLALALVAPHKAFAQGRFVRGMRVAAAPPAMRYEVPPPAPSPRHQWIAGYWAYRGNGHVWIPGAWVVPPAAGYAWEPARWEQVNGAWMFYEGHWRTGEVAAAAEAWQPPPPPVQQVVADVAPPTVVEEERGPVPFEGAVWLPGYWHWVGRQHLWVAGRWSARPAGFEWEPHRWEGGGPGRWVAHPGHWMHR